MRQVAERPISEHEAKVLELALRRGAETSIPDSIFADVTSLRVIGECACGCRSVYFSPESRKDVVLANTTGKTADGKQIDVMVWGAEGRLTSLDLVDHHSTGQLPTPESIGGYTD
jgi:hypothetical protein